ncbi:MAG TPA: PaaI family thioesterase [Methylomirabilota bacterium]|nr:PaaI family thioesterase [Methylomirabilota bacterium]
MTGPAPLEAPPSPEAVRLGLAAIGRHRRRRLHLYGHLLDLGWHVVRPGTVRATLPVTRRLWDAGGALAETPVATLADVAMGMALRSRRSSAGVRFPTVSLDIQHGEAPRSGRVTAVASVFALDGSTGLVRCELTATGAKPVAVATGAFLCRPLPAGAEAPDLGLVRRASARLATRGPWDAGLSHEERQFVLDLGRALERQRRADDPFAAYLGVETLDAPEGEARLRLPVASTLTNIVGHAQGGVVYGLAALACARAGGGRALAVSVRFLRPGVGPAIVASARVIHAGREVATVECDLADDDGRMVAAAIASVQRRSQE